MTPSLRSRRRSRGSSWSSSANSTAKRSCTGRTWPAPTSSSPTTSTTSVKKNNLHYVVKKVRGSKLSQLLGHEWVAKHEDKERGYVANCERLGWSKVLAAIPDRAAAAEIGVGAATEAMRQFNRAFEDAYRCQAGWWVADGKMRDELKVSIARKLLPAYGEFYERCRVVLRDQRDSAAVVRFAPEDLGNYLSDMFYGSGGVAGSASSSVSGSSKGSRQSR